MSSLRRIVILAALGLLAGCSVLQPKPDYSHFYLLNPLTAKTAPAPPPDPTLTLVVDDTVVPEYLNRPQIVARLPGDEVTRDEYHRWGEPLGEGISRVLAQDLALLSDSSHVAWFPIPAGFGQEFEVDVEVLQFDGPAQGTVTLSAQWRITGPGGKPNYYAPARATVLTREVKHAEAGDPAAEYVDALSLLVGDLAREMVNALPAAHAAKATAAR
jgi:uncharacterized lipoprotein YmbA